MYFFLKLKYYFKKLKNIFSKKQKKKDINQDDTYPLW